MRRSQECTVAQVSRAWPPAPPPGWPERVSQGCPTRAREVLLLAKERALHLHDPRLAYEMCHYLAEQPNKRNHAAVERIVTTVPRNATTYPRFIALEAWHTFIFLPADSPEQARYRSARSGPKPVITVAATITEELAATAAVFDRWLKEGTTPRDHRRACPRPLPAIPRRQRVGDRGIAVHALDRDELVVLKR